MEGVGSRMGRTSSRHGANPSPPVFNGPVRKWKKQWVRSQPKKKSNNQEEAPTLLLCRWTPLAERDQDQPRKRRFRYTPTVPIEREKKEVHENVGPDDRMSKTNLSTDTEDMKNDDLFENHTTEDLDMEEPQEFSEG